MNDIIRHLAIAGLAASVAFVACYGERGADTDFTCEASNRYGWGMARSQNKVVWDRHPDNPFGLSAQSPYGCGNDMPSIFRRASDGTVFVYHTSDDTTRIVRERLVVD